MDSARETRLEEVYAKHPLTANAVVARVLAERGTLEGVRERDLAEAMSGPTDQNHVGGAATVRALAAAIDLGPGSTVLDVGAGLGGASRVLAEEFGCRCHGVELTASRYWDAVRLTRLVGLDGVVTYSHGDFLTVTAPNAPYDAAICLGAAMHFLDLDALVRRLVAHVRPGGRIVIEDGVVVGGDVADEEREAIAALERCWHGRLQTIEAWRTAASRAGMRIDAVHALSDLAVRDLEGLVASDTDGHLGPVTADERTGWELGLRLLGRGRLAFVRILATRG